MISAIQQILANNGGAAAATGLGVAMLIIWGTVIVGSI
jgi:hypothetical protein